MANFKTKANDDTKRAALALFEAAQKDGEIRPWFFQSDGHAMENLRPAVLMLLKWGAIERVGITQTYRLGIFSAHQRASILKALATKPRTESDEDRAARVWATRRRMF